MWKTEKESGKKVNVNENEIQTEKEETNKVDFYTTEIDNLKIKLKIAKEENDKLQELRTANINEKDVIIK